MQKGQSIVMVSLLWCLPVVVVAPALAVISTTVVRLVVVVVAAMGLLPQW